MADIDAMCGELRFAGFHEVADELTRLAPFERESEQFAAELNRRRSESSVFRAELTELGVPSMVGEVTLTLCQRLRLLAKGRDIPFQAYLEHFGKIIGDAGDLRQASIDVAKECRTLRVQLPQRAEGN